jgi:hypothetical protein
MGRASQRQGCLRRGREVNPRRVEVSKASWREKVGVVNRLERARDAVGPAQGTGAGQEQDE